MGPITKFFSLNFKSLLYYKNFLYFILDYYGYVRNDYILCLRNGTKLLIRAKGKNKVGDINIVEEIIMNSQYRIGDIINGNVIDIGAHIGISALFFSGKVKGGKIFAYEPFPDNYKQLKANVKLNEPILKGGIEISPFGVWSSKKRLKLYANEGNTGAHTIFGEKQFDYVYIECNTLEQIFTMNKLKRIALLKMDCEGAEYEILFNTPQYIFKRIDEIVMELHMTPATEKLYKKERMLTFLRDKGFSVSILKEIYYPKEGWFWIIKAKNKKLQV